MLALEIIGGIVLLFVLLGQVRVGVAAAFGGELRVAVRIGPVTKQLVPPPEKRPRAEKKKKETAAKPAAKKETPMPRLTFSELRAALAALWQALQGGLRQTGRRVRIQPAQVSVTVGDEDPAAAAELYGYLSAAVWTVMPRLEQLTQLPEPYVHTGVDFGADTTKVEGTVGLSLRLHDALVIGAAFIKPLLRWGIPFLRAKKAQQAAARQEKAKSEKAASEKKPEDTKIA